MSTVNLLVIVLRSVLQRWYAVIPLLILTRIVYLRFFHPLKNVPGPFFASISKGWLIYHAWQGKQHLVHLKCHEIYGPVYRSSPNSIVVADPLFAQNYFTYDKSDWWLSTVLRVTEDTATNFTFNSKEHAAKKKRVSAAYTLTSVLQKEPSVDEILTQFVKKSISSFAGTGEPFDMAYWAYFITLDTVMEIVYSGPLGFTRRNEDVHGLLASLHGVIRFISVVGFLPLIMKIALNPFIYPWVGPDPTDKTGPGVVLGISEKAVESRLAIGNPKTHRDMLQTMIAYRDQNGQGIPHETLKMECLAPVFAGLDTLSGSIRAAVLYIATNHPVRQKLVAELDEAERAGHLSHPAKFNELQALDYLPAVIREVIRILPVVGGPMWRLIPSGGKMIHGHHIPAGTEVGMNMWNLSRDKSVYGEDAAFFRPERWVEDSKKVREWEKVDAYFGMGNYSCLGKNVARMLLFKIVAQLFRNFEIVVANPSAPWVEFNAVVFACKDFWCCAYERDRRDGCK